MSFDSTEDSIPGADAGSRHDTPTAKDDAPADFAESAPSDFEDPTLDIRLDADPLGQIDEITKLIVFLQGVSYANYQRQDFDDRLDAAKFALQSLNYYKDQGVGYLKEEADRLAVHYDGVPLVIAWLCGFSILVLTVSTLFFHVAMGEYPFQAALNLFNGNQNLEAYATAVNSVFIFLASLLTGFVFYVLGRGLSAWRWWADFEYRNAGNMRAKNIRLRNHDVLVNKIKNLQHVAGERARNKDPDRGASGLLRVYLLFVCGYVLHKTLNRCHTRFKQDFGQIWVPGVKARIRQLRWMALVACVGFGCIVAYKVLNWKSDTSLIFSLGSIIMLPLVIAWAVQRSLHRYALRGNGNVMKKLNFLNSLYHTHISNTLLTAFNEPETERARFDFPDIYQYNDVEEYATWLHNTLNALKRHEDETRK